jgi:hypothetical protein
MMRIGQGREYRNEGIGLVLVAESRSQYFALKLASLMCQCTSE